MWKKVEQDWVCKCERVVCSGIFILIYVFSSSLFVFMKHRSAGFFPLFWYVVCIQSGSEVCVLCAFTIEWTTSNQEPNFRIWENSMSGMRHLIRLLHVMKHHVTNIQSRKFSVPPLISNHLRWESFPKEHVTVNDIQQIRGKDFSFIPRRELFNSPDPQLPWHVYRKWTLRITAKSENVQ